MLGEGSAAAHVGLVSGGGGRPVLRRFLEELTGATLAQDLLGDSADREAARASGAAVYSREKRRCDQNPQAAFVQVQRAVRDQLGTERGAPITFRRHTLKRIGLSSWS